MKITFGNSANSNLKKGTGILFGADKIPVGPQFGMTGQIKTTGTTKLIIKVVAFALAAFALVIIFSILF